MYLGFSSILYQSYPKVRYFTKQTKSSLASQRMQMGHESV
jgi:hypothetical protein